MAARGNSYRVTISTEGWITTGILLATLAAFASGRLRSEVIALGAVLLLGLSGVATPAAAFAGFGDPTVVAIACLFVLSAALERTGIASGLARSLLRTVGTRELTLIVTFMLLAGVLSSVMYHIGAMAMLLPVTIAVCRETRLSPSRLLMPLAIGARLGGALTLIGKPSNLIVSGFLVQAGYAPLTFFSFLPIGIVLLAVGVAFMATIGRRLLPTAAPEGFSTGAARRDLRETYRLPERLFRIRVDAGSTLEGKTIAQTALRASFGINVVAVLRGRQRMYAPAPRERLAADDTLLVQARPEDMRRVLGDQAVELQPDATVGQEPLETDDIGLGEVVIAPRAELLGRSLKELEFRQRYALNVLAIWRQGRPMRTWLADLPLEYGDALLVQGPRERIRLLGRNPNFISLDEPPPPRTSRVGVALLGVAALVVPGAAGIVPVALAALLAAGIVVVGGCVTSEEAFDAVDWATVIVTGALLPLGIAFHRTGAAAALAGAVVSLAGGGLGVALVLVFLVAFLIGQVMPAVPATILMAPIALGAATAIGANPTPFLITVASSTSVTLLTPVSHPISLMVMGPGGYRFGDYARVGAPLAVVLSVALLAVVAAVYTR
ncbi:MAG: SLC13 family permease [bacterium]